MKEPISLRLDVEEKTAWTNSKNCGIKIKKRTVFRDVNVLLKIEAMHAGRNNIAKR